MKRTFEDDLPLLHRRAFPAEVAVARAISRQASPAAALLKAIDAWQQEAYELFVDVEALKGALEGRAPVEQRALLAAWMRRRSSPLALAGDLASLRRDFSLDCVRERAIAQRDVLGAQTEFALAALLPALRDEPELRSAAGARLRRTVHSHERPPTRRRAAGLLVDLLALEPEAEWAASVGRELTRLALDAPDVWVRRQAVGVVPHLGARSRERLLVALEADTTNDGALVRARAVEVCVQAGLLEPLSRWRDDPSEIVRFTLVQCAVQGEHGTAWRAMLAHPDARTRAVLAAELGRRAGNEDGLVVLCGDLDPLVLRFVYLSAARLGRAGPLSVALADAVRKGLQHERVPVRRAAERAVAWIEHQASPARELAAPLAALKEEQSRWVGLPLNVRPLDLAIALRPFAMEGFGFTLRPGRRGVRVSRGDVMRIAGWRVVHELRNPAPSKRQGHTHTVGPRLMGPIQLPPVGLAEQSATGIPGQRVQVVEGDWGSHLPTLDDYRRALAYGTSWVVSGTGVAEVRRPKGLFNRLRARWWLLWRYEVLHSERMAALEQRREARYLGRFEKFGFEHTFAVGGFLPYLLGTSGNTLVHLALFIALFWFLLLGANVWMRSWILYYRSRLGLVVGGWGTRGKSGTERIKAGMLHGCGVPFVSKTTGCEAMILHGPRGDSVRELFLFRPYDKATIWEQADVMRFASSVGASTMIWECMALNPRYVDLLQRGWMRDDLSTLTNAYPDHEDVMGPTGMDVAKVIGSFSPKGSPVFTTEENMLPAIQAEAERQGSMCTALTPEDKELIPAELLVRFPYAEHPSNIALAARIGTELGLHRVEAIGWMADHVVPDLGALMVCPEVLIEGRKVVFVNGHSANDELSFTHSWTSTGFADHRVQADPDEWLVGVVNNRADRVPRSRVFARMAVRVAAAHRFLVIGTNLSGFATYVEEALVELLTGLDLDDEEVWAGWQEHLKIVDPARWLERCGAPRLPDFASLPPTQDLREARGALARLDLTGLETWRPWIEEEAPFFLLLRSARSGEARRALLAERIRSRIRYHQDTEASGDVLVTVASELAPPGARVRMIGMQNIKGTGLDFCYQWIRWRALYDDLQVLDAERASTFSVKRLTAVFMCDAVLRALGDGTHDLQQAVVARRDELLALRTARPDGSALGRFLGTWLWRVVDPIDAIYRRRRSRLIFRDLAAARIGHDDAVEQLAALTKRQK